MTGSAGAWRNNIRFGPFDVDIRLREIRKLGIKIRLRHKSFEILAALLERPGDVVTREELQSRLWPSDVFVDFENNLNTAVTRLREALGDSAEQPRYIETVARLGYRFISSVTRPGPQLEKHGVGSIRLAVLPFENMSEDPAQEYFTDGVTEELIGELACMAPGRLGVIARTSALQYKGTTRKISQIGRELNVDYIVEGSIRRTGNRVRISAQLVKVGDQTHLWANSYDGELRDALRLQRDVARAIADQIDISLANAGREPKPAYGIDPEAYDAYLLGLHYFGRASPADFSKAEQCFRSALDRNPDFAPAYAKLAMTHALSAFFGYSPHSESFPRAQWAAEKALSIDSCLAEAHGALATVHWFHHWDVPACERELDCALALNPNDPVARWTRAMFLGSMKQDHLQAAHEAGVAVSLDPLSIAIRSMNCWLPYWARRYDQAIAQARLTLQLDENAPQACYVLGTAARAKGAFVEAIATLEQAASRFADPFSLAYLGMTYGLAGQHDQALNVLCRLRQACGDRPIPPIFAAFVYAGLGDKSAALDCIENAVNERDPFVLWLGVSPDWDCLRGEPRFQQFLRRLNLTNRVIPESLSSPTPRPQPAASESRSSKD